MFETEETENSTHESLSSESGSSDTQVNLEADQSTDQQSQFVDLDKVERFRFAGREWTPKDFQGAYMMQSDYTRKTQALAEERKFYDNLASDLENVKRNPALATEFKRVYPQKFHAYLNYVSNTQPQANQTEKSQAQGSDPEFVSRFNQMETWFKTQTQQAADAEVDAMCSKFSQKYPTVKGSYEALALGILQSKLDSLKQSNPQAKLSEKDWESAYKSVHDENQKLAKQLYSEQVKQQTRVNAKAKDVASGGGIPGAAPKLPRTIKEASDLALRELENS